MKKTFEIKKWTDGSVIYSGEAESLELLVKIACESGVSLNYANLNNLDFSDMVFPDNSKFDNSKFDNSKFYNSTFYNSKFYNSKFYNSTFYNSTFYNSKFDNNTFDNSKFDNSTFYNSTFYNSTFDNSKFYNSTFYNSTFYNSTFDNSTANSLKESGALESIKMDFFGRMLMLKKEVPFLLQSLRSGKIDGSSYSGTCACFIGTIAHGAKCDINSLAVKPDANSDTEKWFMGIDKGDTPETSQIAKITEEYILEFLELTSHANI